MALQESEYERVRNRNILRNENFLKQLELNHPEPIQEPKAKKTRFTIHYCPYCPQSFPTSSSLSSHYPSCPSYVSKTRSRNRCLHNNDSQDTVTLNLAKNVSDERFVEISSMDQFDVSSMNCIDQSLLEPHDDFEDHSIDQFDVCIDHSHDTHDDHHDAGNNAANSGVEVSDELVRPSTIVFNFQNFLQQEYFSTQRISVPPFNVRYKKL